MEYSINSTEVFRPGDKIQSRYRILNRLGTGGFGRTYLAEDTNRFNEKCVLKVFTPRISENFTLEKALEMFEREAETLHRLEHPQIPKFHQILRHEIGDSECLLLVQDFIKGDSYLELLNQRAKTGKHFNEQEIELLLLKVLPILEYIHSHGIIHRDISPENLILDNKRQLPILIDFGCIKEIENQVHLNVLAADSIDLFPVVGTAIGKAYYAPPEQVIKGVVSPHTDLYALAATSVVLLTGQKPQELRDGTNLQWRWQAFAKVHPQLAKILSKMLDSIPEKRFQNAMEVKQALQDHLELNSSHNNNDVSKTLQPKQDPSLKKLAYTFLSSLKTRNLQLLTLALLLICGGLLLSQIGKNFSGSRAFTFEKRSIKSSGNTISPYIPIILHDKFSSGERLLVAKLTTPQKEKAAKAYAQGNYQEAATFFADSLKRKPNDPEALIYFNNARIAHKASYNIAVSVPIKTNVSSALEVMRGVAQAQDQINKRGGIKGIPLRIQVVNDENNPELAQQIASTLSHNRKILGVIGHYSSEVTLATAEIYQEAGLIAVSPISSSVRLTNLSPYIFRTVSSDFIAARALAQYAVEEQKQQNVAIFYNSESEHSKSLKSEFNSAVTLIGGRVVRTFDLADPDFNPVKSFQEALDVGAEALMLSTDPMKLDKALQVIQINRGRLSLYGGDDIYTAKTLQLSGKDAEGMVLEIPWHINSNLDSDFVKESRQLWNADVSWRTAMGYDAAQALITAISVNSSRVTRSNIQKALADPSFVAPGANEEVKFLPSGDRVNNIQLVEIKAVNNNSSYEYVPFEP